MRWTRRCLPLSLAAVLAMPCLVLAAAEGQHSSHRTLSGVVAKKGNNLVVKTPDGATYQANENASLRHGHEPFKEGDEVTVMVDENNAIIDMHHKGEEGKHAHVTGKLVYMGKMKPEIKLQTSDGEKVFPLAKQDIKTKPIAEGTVVTVELNEAGSVIDLHPAK